MSLSESSYNYPSQSSSNQRQPYYEKQSAVPIQDPDQSDHCNLVAFLAAAQACGVDLYPLVWNPVENFVGKGGTADVRQRMMSEHFSFIFKALSLSRLSDGTLSENDSGTGERRAFQALIAELSILTHPTIRDHANTMTLDGVCWEVSKHNGRAWPVLMFEKAHFGDLGQFIGSDAGRSLEFESSLKICRGIASAIAAMHASHIIHGDIKPGNVLVSADGMGSPIPKVSDFGYSTVAANLNDLVKLPISKPWNAPQIHQRACHFKISEAKKMDAYSFGLLCLWILYENRFEGLAIELKEGYGDDEDSPIAESLMQTVEHIKAEKGLLEFTQILVALTTDISDEQRDRLTKFFQSTLTSDLDDRSNNFVELLQLLGHNQELPDIEALVIDHSRDSWAQFIRGSLKFRPYREQQNEQHTGSAQHPNFQIAAHYVDLIKADFRVRNHVVQCLQDQAYNDPCEECRLNAAFQMALCSKLGFAVAANEQESLRWLGMSLRDSLDNEIETTSMDPIPKSYRILELVAKGLPIQLESGHHYAGHGILPTAESQIRRELDDMQVVLGHNHPAITGLKLILSSILEVKGDYSGAETLYRDLLEVSGQREFGVIEAYINLAICQQHQHRLEEAEETLSQASERMDQLGERKDFILVRLKCAQAEVYVEQGRLQMAERMYKEALESEERLLGYETETKWHLLLGLALSIFRQHKSYEAELIFEEVAEGTKNRLGEDHLFRKRGLQWLADAQFANGKYRESEKTYREVIPLAEKRFGKSHFETVKAYSGLVATLNIQGNFQESAALLDDIFGPFQDIAMDDNVELFEVLSKISLHFVDAGKGEMVVPFLLRLKDVYSSQQRLSHPGFLAAMTDLASALYKAKQLRRAEEIYKIIEQPMLETKHPSCAIMMNNYGLLLTDKLELADAKRKHTWAWEVEKSIHGEEHPAVLSSLNNIARVEMAQGQLRSAERKFRKVLRARVRLFGHTGYYTLRSYTNLRAVLTLQGNTEDLRRLREAEIMHQDFPEMEEGEIMNDAGGISGNIWRGCEIPIGYDDLTAEIRKDGLELLGAGSCSPNCLFEDSSPAALKTHRSSGASSSEEFVTSDVDEQLLLFIKFKRAVKVHSIQLTSLPENGHVAQRPARVKLFTEKPYGIRFEDAELEDGVQTFPIEETDWDNERGTVALQVRYVKFQTVHDLVIFVSHGEGEYTRLDRVRIIGK